MRTGATSLARSLRRTETDAEKAIWRKLRNRRTGGWKFKRQVPFGKYVLDFFCSEARLAIEIDGASHGNTGEIASDRERTAFLRENGVRVLRFQNAEALENIDGVIEMIYADLGQQTAPSPGASRRPLPEGRGGTNAEAR
ncbi:MAG: endonuclease domain-containing protein [Hyphomicrobium sp.]